MNIFDRFIEDFLDCTEYIFCLTFSVEESKEIIQQEFSTFCSLHLDLDENEYFNDEVSEDDYLYFVDLCIHYAKEQCGEFLQGYQIEYFDLDKRHLIDLKTFDEHPGIFSILTTREEVEKRELENSIVLNNSSKKKFKL